MPYPSLYHFQRKAYLDMEKHSRQHLLELLIRAYTYIDTLYDERLQTVSLLATLAYGLGYVCGVYRLPPAMITEPGWRSLVIVDIPAGQLCWPVDDNRLVYFRALPLYTGTFEGFPEAQEQTRRLLRPRCGFLFREQTERIPTSFFLPEE